MDELHRDPAPGGATPAPSIGPGREIGPFRILRALGRGGMGVVWLARDQRLGRRVAVKVIDAERLVAAGARERFRREAAATARLSHPHIVTLYEVGEVDGAPWVALEYIDGVTLRARLEDDPPPLREGLTIALAIADALGAAHRHGILHRDLKPSNIILGKDGRPRVVDFGLARRVGDRTAEVIRVPAEELDDTDSDADDAMLAPIGDSGAVGTPKYMAPEQWRREEPTTAADVWALGLVLHELVHGVHPYAQLDRRGLRAQVESSAPVPAPAAPRPIPPALADLLAQCLDKRPAARPSADAVHAALARLLERTGAADDGDSPFRGLLAYSERQADTFFGRDAEIAAFVERLRDEPILPVVGPSGAGKSSFVQAGVVPRLHERGWTVLHVRCGRRPLVALAQRLVLGEHSAPAPLTQLQETESTAPASGPARAEARLAPARPPVDPDALAARLGAEPGLLGVELRALAEQRHARVLLFVDQLEELYAGVDEAERRAFLRALAAAADDPADPVRVVATLRDDFLGRVAEVEAMAAALSHVTVLRSPGPEALRDILRRPAERAGYQWDDGLVDDMVAAVAAAPAGLPLLAFTARQVWHRRDKQARRLTRAAYDDLGGIAGALAAHADGVIAGLPERDERVVRDLLLRLVSAAGTRRVVPRGDLLSGLPDGAAGMLQRLVEARLVTTRRALAGGDAEVELAHESLVHSWDRLARWVDEGRDDRAFLEHAAQAAAHWRARGRRDDDLWHGEALADARRALGRLGDRSPAEVRALLAASERAATRGRRRRRAFVAVVVVALAVIAVSAWVAAFRIAREERAARRRFADAQREAARAALSSGDLLAARARLRSSLEVEDSVSARALWMRMAAEPLRWTHRLPAAVYDVAVAPDGGAIAAVGQEGLIRLLDPVTGRERILAKGGDQLFAVAWSPDGRWIATGSWSGDVSLWDAATATRRVLGSHTGTVQVLEFDGAELVSGGEDGTIRRWDVARGAPLATWRADGSEVADLAIGPGGDLVTASWDGGVRRWSRDGHATLIGQAPGAATALAYDAARDEVLVGDRDGNVLGWSGGGRRVVGHVDGSVSRLVIEPASRRLAVSASTGRVELWGLDDGAAEELSGHDAEVRALAIAGDWMVSGSADHAVKRWDLGVHARRRDPGHTMTVVGVDLSPDGRLAISAGYDKVARLWDVGTGRTIGVLRGHQARVYAARLLPGGRAVTASADGTLRLWDGVASVRVAPVVLPGGRYYAVAASADGALIVSGGTDGIVHLWWPATDRVAALPVHEGGTVDGVAISADGARIAAGGSDAVVRVFDVATLTLVRELRGHAVTVPGVSFSPDGQRLASCDEGGAVWVWDLARGDGRRVWQGARSYRVEFLPDGRHVGVAAADGLAHLLDTEGAEPPRELRGHLDEVNEIRFSADGQLAVTGSNDTTVRVWDVATGAPRWHATVPATPWRGSVPAELEDAPATSPTAGADGPDGTIALGFDSGIVGLWDRATGEHLDGLRLHGPVAALRFTGAALAADSQLGDHADLDLSALELPYCDLLRAVWAAVPVVWEGLRPVRAGPPGGHRCR